MAWVLPSAQGVCDALADCVIYQVGGPYRAEATGLSCYYSYSGDIDDFNGYIDVGAGLAFKHLFAHGLTGELEEGDKITTIWQLASYSGDDDFEMYAAEELTVTADTSFGEAPLFDGQYGMLFEMWDAMGNYVWSGLVTFDCVGGEIITTVYN